LFKVRVPEDVIDPEVIAPLVARLVPVTAPLAVTAPEVVTAVARTTPTLLRFLLLKVISVPV
jgi:hypothetical protein